jgi:Arc/MetJ-type ribon-helix-helix transcriptional regulator
MLIYIRISEALKAKVDQLVSRGQYSDLSAVVTVALENLVLAEQEQSDLAKPPAARADVKGAAPAKVARSKPGKEDPSARAESSRPAIFNWTEAPAISEKLIVPLPADLFRLGQQVPVERWIFGQQNRALPAKVNSRLFIALVAEAGAELELFDAASAISFQAAAVFAFLTDLDQRFASGKDDQLSTGFPEPGSEKAMSRYANHFAAYESTQGNLTGMLLQWKLAGVKRAKNKTYLLPTKACIDFAALANPLLDRPVTEKPTEKFSAAEIDWLVAHIAEHVPVEASAFRTVLAGLTEGCNTPDALDRYVKEHAKEKGDVSEAFVSTQRSGAVSRMADLDLVRRQRDGTKVSYEVTKRGVAWLEKNGGNDN